MGDGDVGEEVDEIALDVLVPLDSSVGELLHDFRALAVAGILSTVIIQRALLEKNMLMDLCLGLVMLNGKRVAPVELRLVYWARGRMPLYCKCEEYIQDNIPNTAVRNVHSRKPPLTCQKIKHAQTSIHYLRVMSSLACNNASMCC